ncbi:Two-domain outward rectifier K(+) channel YORK [Hyphodiscus hymeniophilus]|uniref:Two-domain outward rectifier K(+) channel YORK n=1 Tax=Hyphodiscus hymeniophilus TaxID=353542 RepID=A0A9P6VM47_9HELO|nr:Two-domain outward rectifier K(+) channel YORK [Hyphodiscus hymeniophilus]
MTASTASHSAPDEGAEDTYTADKASEEVEMGSDSTEDDKQFYERTYIWYTETVFPLASACFGPMASAFNICALAEDWRVFIPPGGTEAQEVAIADPTWVVIINAVSLAIGVLANLALLLGMAHRLSFTISQPITIAGWYISSILLLVIIGLTPSHLDIYTEYAFAQPFVYACLAASIYFFLASLLVFTTLYAKKGHYSPDFSETLTLPQRTLMAQSTSFIVYLMCGAAVFSHIEHWRLVDGLYWATITLLTIGYGDIVPVTHLGRSLIIPYAIAGIIMLGLVAGSVGSLVLDRAQRKMSARWTIRERSRLERRTAAPRPEGATDIGKERREFNDMRRIQSRAQNRHRWTILAISIFALFMLWLFGAAVFWRTENTIHSFQTSRWSYFDAVYFVFISLLTIGYGDFAVRSNVGRPVFVFWGLLAIPTMTILIASMGATVLVLIKGIIQRIDAFVVLPHEGGGEKTSFSRKAFHHAKLKHKVRVGHNGAGKSGPGHDGHLYGHEIHSGGIRDPNSGKILNLERHTEDVPRIDYSHDEAVQMRNFLLAKEIRALFEDMPDSQKKYSYEEWARYLKLLGVRHRASDVASVIDAHSEQRDQEVRSEWGWLRDDGPLFGKKSEPEWVLDRLTKALVDNLRPDDMANK